MDEVFVNVSELPAPEPFDRIMQAVKTLSDNNYLKAVHRKQPLLLYKPLQQLGFNFHVQAGEEFPFEIFIWKHSLKPPAGIRLPNIARLNSGAQNCSDC